jgi:hypothetical protein
MGGGSGGGPVLGRFQSNLKTWESKHHKALFQFAPPTSPVRPIAAQAMQIAAASAYARAFEPSPNTHNVNDEK